VLEPVHVDDENGGRRLLPCGPAELALGQLPPGRGVEGSVLASIVAAWTRSRSSAWYCNKKTAGRIMTANHGTRTSASADIAPRPSVANSTTLSETDPNRFDGLDAPRLRKMTDEISAALTTRYVTAASSNVAIMTAADEPNSPVTSVPAATVATAAQIRIATAPV
jgi:hypothetical protein